MRTLIIAPVGVNCNFVCSYCYQKKLNRKGCVISIEDLKTIYRNYHEIEDKKINIIWHGGEPCLMGLNLFEKAIKLQRNYWSKKINLYNSIQTNGILLDENWIKIFTRYKIKVSVSIDGPAAIQNQHRKTIDGKNTFKTVFQNVLKLKDAGLLEGILVVVTPETAPYLKNTYHFFVTHGLTHLEFTPAYTPENQIDKVIVKNMLSLLKRWLIDDNPKIRIRMFWGVIRSLCGGKPLTCGFILGGCKDYLLVNGNLDVFPCARLIDKADYYLGNLSIDSLKTIVKGKKYHRILEKLIKIPKACKSCKWLSFCGGGCPAERLENNFTHSSDCFLKQKLFSYASNFIKKQSLIKSS